MKKIPLTKIGFFNPGRLSDEEIEQNFISRIPFFEYLFKKITDEPANSIPQHYLVIGQRGMGKTSLLVRIAAELRKSPYRNTFIPLSFPEEQYNIDRLSKFWLNCLDALADALDKENNKTELPELDAEISNLSKEANIEASNIYDKFKKWTTIIKRRPVLLVDNLNLIFQKINKDEQHKLRAVLISNDAPILVGASATSIEETVDYGAPFYDAFQISYLKKLSFKESLDVLQNLAKITGSVNFENTFLQKRGRLEALYQLTGGTPRTLAILFPLIQNGFSESIQTDLDALLDAVTPLYKARFEELAPQLQVVMDAVALNWDPINLEKLRVVTQLENAQLSPQLKRLVDVGWLQKLDAYKAKGGAYELSERFFNVWYLMRRSSRRQKRELYCLTKFLESFYGDGLHAIARKRMTYKSQDIYQITLDLALADAIKGSIISEKLRTRSYETLLVMSEIDKDILKNFSIPDSISDKKISQILKKVDSTIKLKKYETAKDILLNAIENDSNCKKCWNKLGNLYNLYFGNYAEAESAYKKAIKIDSYYIAPFYNLGNLYQYQLKKYSESEAFYEKAISIDENDSDIWHNIGNLYQYHLDKFIEAEYAYKKSIEIEAGNSYSWNGLGNLYKNHMAKYVDAEHAFKKAIEINEKYASPYINLGNLYQYNLKQFEASEIAYKKAISIDKNNASLWDNLGDLYHYRLSEYLKAESAYKKAIEINGVQVISWISLGDLYHFHLSEYKEAEVAYKKAIEIDNTNPFVWNSLGYLYTECLKEYQLAEIAFKKAIELNDKLIYPWYNLGKLYEDYLEKFILAEHAFKTCLEIDDKDPDLWNTIGHLYHMELKNYREAETSYLRAIQLDPTQVYPQYNLSALWRDKLDNVDKAKAILDGINPSERIAGSHSLFEAVFSFYSKNLGDAKLLIKTAFVEVGETLPTETQQDWYRSAAVIIKLGYGTVLLEALADIGYNVIMRPLYVAIEALIKKNEPLFFNSIAAEVREPAKKIMEKMEKYNN